MFTRRVGRVAAASVCIRGGQEPTQSTKAELSVGHAQALVFSLFLFIFPPRANRAKGLNIYIYCWGLVFRLNTALEALLEGQSIRDLAWTETQAEVLKSYQLSPPLSLSFSLSFSFSLSHTHTPLSFSFSFYRALSGAQAVPVPNLQAGHLRRQRVRRRPKVRQLRHRLDHFALIFLFICHFSAIKAACSTVCSILC